MKQRRKTKKDVKKDSPKKEKNADVGGDDEDEDKPKDTKKPKNPLDLIETKFDLEQFKRDFMNSKDRKATLAEFWKIFDANAFSFWWLEYQKLPSEGKVYFKTNNAASMFLQKLDQFRKYSFGTYGVYGVEGDYECRGVFMWKGLDIPQEVKDHDNFEFMTIKKLHYETDRAFIEEYWLNLNENDKVDGRLATNVQTFK